MLEKIQSYSDGKYDLTRKDIENIYLEQQGNAAEQIEAMDITKRVQSTGQLIVVLTSQIQADPPSAKLMQQARSASGSVGRAGSIASSRQTLDRKTSTSTYDSKAGVAPPPGRTMAAPPPYTSSPASATAGDVKKAPAPPPVKPKPSFGAPKKYATAIFDFEAQVSVLSAPHGM